MKFKNRIAGILAGAALVATLGIAAPATVAPVQTVSNASAACIDSWPNFRVYASGWTGWKGAETYSQAYSKLHNPVYMTGYIRQEIWPSSGGCPYWATVHYDNSTTS